MVFLPQTLCGIETHTSSRYPPRRSRPTDLEAQRVLRILLAPRSGRVLGFVARAGRGVGHGAPRALGRVANGARQALGGVADGFAGSAHCAGSGGDGEGERAGRKRDVAHRHRSRRRERLLRWD